VAGTDDQATKAPARRSNDEPMRSLWSTVLSLWGLEDGGPEISTPAWVALAVVAGIGAIVVLDRVHGVMGWALAALIVGGMSFGTAAVLRFHHRRA
jgi:hypothetical protein